MNKQLNEMTDLELAEIMAQQFGLFIQAKDNIQAIQQVIAERKKAQAEVQTETKD